jgi:hypothetical protein
MSNIGQILAMSGQNVGSQIGSGYAGLGQNVQGMLTGIGGNIKKKRNEREGLRLLEQHQNNPNALFKLSQQYAIQGNTELASAFKTAAERAQQVSDRKVARTDASVADAKKRRDALIEGRAATDEAFDEAVTMRRALLDAKERAEREGATDKDKQLYELLKTRAITPNDYAKEVLKEDKKGSETKGYKEKAQVLRGGKLVEVVSFYAADGTFLSERVLGEVVESEGSEGRGSVGSNVEKRNNQISAESTKSSIGLARNRQLQQELITSQKTTGILSDWRTSVLDIAGLRDAEEEAKTAFLRTRNTDIINSLPPGVASDTDVRIFSQGFPAANASSEEILRYLQAEERILAASSDMSLVADRHLASQINAGLDATMVGFEDKKQRYASIMQKARRDIEEKTANAQTEQEAIDIEREVIKQVSEVLGFVPKFYR